MFAGSKLALLVCGTLWFMAVFAFGDASYQRTRDGKTVVWNDIPKYGDAASWTGRRDRDGYAKGFGTLTWYTAPSARGGGSAVYARYFGNMVRGKFVGPINAHSKRKTAHAVYVDGKRTTRWMSGPAPSWRVAQAPIKLSKPIPAAEPEAPGEGVPNIAEAKPLPPAVSARGELQRQIENTPRVRRRGFDKFLRVLVEPPSTLRTSGASARAPEMGARLSKEEAAALADGEARARGYNLSNYQPPEPHYDATTRTWSISYGQRPFNAIDEPDKDFHIVIDDETKESAIPDN